MSGPVNELKLNVWPCRKALGDKPRADRGESARVDTGDSGGVLSQCLLSCACR